MSGPALASLVSAGAQQQDAVAIGDHIFMSRGVSNCYQVGTRRRRAAREHRAAARGRGAPQPLRARVDEPVRVIVFTQSHGDHIGGWTAFNGPGVDTIVQSNFADVRGYWNRLAPFYGRRTAKLWGSVAATRPSAGRARALPPDPVPTITFDDSYSFKVGGTRVELFAVPGGETTDSLAGLAARRTVAFSGNLLGPMYRPRAEPLHRARRQAAQRAALCRVGRPAARAGAGSADHGSRRPDSRRAARSTPISPSCATRCSGCTTRPSPG